MRRRAAILAAVVLASLVAPLRPATAATRVVVVTATLTVDAWEGEGRTDLWAPAAPPCGVAATCPHVATNVDLTLSDPGTCVLADSLSSQRGLCVIEGFTGEMRRVGPGELDGPWCGYAVGVMELSVRLNGVTEVFTGAGVTAHAGPAFAWRVFRTGSGGDLDNAGAGAALVTGMRHVDAAGVERNGSCGLAPPDFRPTNRLDLAVQVVWTDPA